MKPGQKILERYTLGERISSGGQATVHLAVDEVTGNTVIAKIFTSHGYLEHEKERLLREIEILSQLDHPNIIRSLDSGAVDESVHVLILEYGDGEPLNERMKTHGFLLSDVIILGQQLADALLTAHHLGIVHRDIKPSNILVRCDENGCLIDSKLLDFGIAKSDANQAGLTVSGAVLGTPCYMPPEQALAASEVSELADVYSLAVVMYEMTVGRLPWKSSDELVRLGTMLTETAIPLRTISQATPDLYAELIENCLERDSSLRPQSMATFIQCLDKAKRNVPADIIQLCLDERADELILPQSENTEVVDELTSPLSRVSGSASEPTFAATLFELGLSDWNKRSGSNFAGNSKRERAFSEQAESVSVPFTSTGLEHALSKAVDTKRNELTILSMMQAINRQHETPGRSKALSLQLVWGTAGSGKSSLLSQLKETYKKAQVPAQRVSVEAYEWAEMRPYGLCKDILTRLLGKVDYADFPRFRRLVQRRFFETKRPRPSLDSGHNGNDSQATQVVGQDDIQERQHGKEPLARMSTAIAKVLWNDRTTKRERLPLTDREIYAVDAGVYVALAHQIRVLGLLLFVDNAQYADPESLGILRKLAETSARSVGLCVLACSPNKEAVVSALGLNPEQCFVLNPLASSDVERLLAKTPIAKNISLTNTIKRSAKGSPLFLSQLTTIAIENLAGSNRGNENQNHLPATIGEAVTLRTRRLSTTVSDVMCAAAIMGEVFWAEGISKCLKIERKELFAALRTLVNQEMVVADESSMISGFHQFRFTHSVFQTITLALYAQSERRYLHKRISKLLSTIDAVDPFYVISQVTKAGRMDIAAYLYARGANIALEHGLRSRSQELIEQGWNVLPEDTTTSSSSQALRRAQRRLKG